MPKEKSNHNPAKQVHRRSVGAQQPQADSVELRPVFAAYFNMARANLYSVLRYISVQCGLSVKKSVEEHMEKMPVANFADNKHPEVQQKVFSLLLRHIPILQYMMQAYITKAKPAKKGKPAIQEHLQVEYDDLQKLLQNIIMVLNYKRNLFTHANHYDSQGEKNAELDRETGLRGPFDKAFIGSKREVKRIFKYSTIDMKFVDQDERMEKTTGDDGKPLYIEHKDWFFRLFDVDESDPYEKTFRLTAAGMTFLLCKLLHKKYATQLAQKTGLFRTAAHKGSSPFEKKENEVMFNIFCARRIRLPRGRVESTADKSALGLDMLSELQKCPQELFDTLSANDKRLFQVERKDGKPLPEPDDDINLFRRYGDRFTQLTLRYIDAMRDNEVEQYRVLTNIVFQVSLGKFRHKFYNRASLDSTEADRVRVLQKEVNGFGPIHKVEELRKSKEYYGDLIRKISDDSDQLYDADNAQTRPYLTDQHAAYAITGNRIGLMWNVAGSSERCDNLLNNETLCFLPRLPQPKATNDDKTPRQVDEIEHNLIPRAWLSKYDLPALLLLHFLGGNPEEVIKKCYKNLKNLLSDIEKGKLTPTGDCYEETLKKKYHLKLSDVPEKIREYLMHGDEKQNSNEAFRKWMDKRMDGYTVSDTNQVVSGMIKRVEARIAKFKKDKSSVGDNKQNRVGRKGYAEIRPGSLARVLAKEIVSYTSPDDKRHNNGKPSGMDYGVLTAAIAKYKGDGQVLDKTPLGKMLEKAINISHHPFLVSIMNKPIKDTADLYLQYLEEKRKYLEKLREDRNYQEQWFLRESYRNRVAKTKDYMHGPDGLAARYRNTLQLPDGLFNEAIRAKIRELNNPQLNKALDDKDPKNGHGFSHLLYLYFTEILNDDSQPFYNYKRHYKILDVLDYEENSKSKVPNTPNRVAPERFFTADEIASKLKKGNAGKMPLLGELDNHLETLKEKKKKKKKTFIDGKKVYTVYYINASDEVKKAEETKMRHMLRDMQRNEQAIRRHRNNDMLLFLMAKRLLLSGGKVYKDKARVTAGDDQFYLKDILPPMRGNENSILESSVNYALTIGLVDEKGKPICDNEGNQMLRTVKQDGMKIKNYGDFFSFLYDSRIGSLLSQLPDNGEIERTDLENELDTYDRKRDKIFAIIHAIEHAIIEDHPELDDSNASGEGFRDSKSNNIPYRNKFSSLLTLCSRYLAAKGILNTNAQSIVDIRNAFSHNHYTDKDNEQIDISKLTLPQVAEYIIEWLSKQEKAEK